MNGFVKKIMYFYSRNEGETESLGKKLASVIEEKSFILLLQGDLGTGKTVFVRGMLRALGYKEAVKSPTFTLVEPYTLMPHSVFHFDLYRLNHPDELENIGWRDYLMQMAWILIEWPEKAGRALPNYDLICKFKIIDQQREINFISHSLKGQSVVDDKRIKGLSLTNTTKSFEIKG